MVYKRCQLKAIARSIQVDVGDADGDGDGDCLPLGRLLNGLSWRRERICPRQSRCGAQCQWVLVVIVARCHLFSGASEAQAVGVQLPKLTCFLPIVLFFLFWLNGFAAARGTCHLLHTTDAACTAIAIGSSCLWYAYQRPASSAGCGLSQLEFRPELLDLCPSGLGQSQSEQAAKKAINVVRYVNNKLWDTLRTEILL